MPNSLAGDLAKPSESAAGVCSSTGFASVIGGGSGSSTGVGSGSITGLVFFGSSVTTTLQVLGGSGALGISSGTSSSSSSR